MKRLFQFLTQKWIVSLVGIIALIVLIWLGGPYLGIGDSRPLSSPFNRLLATLIVVVGWGLNNLRLRFKATKANAQMIDNLVASPAAASEVAPDASAEEVALLRDRFGKALAHLKQTGLRGRLFGKQYLYELPWYVIIGPPGSGKTTLIENSSLEFPLDDLFDGEKDYSSKKISGVGGTRNCDWWFTNEAVILDTAGRYTTQDSDAEVDSGAWLGFLDLLRKQRPRRPLNGIIIAISAEELLSRTAQERELHALTIRKRINELYTRLGAHIPVYFLLTKVDLVAGFMDFFDDLGKEQRAQVWGFTYQQDPSKQPKEILQTFDNEFDALLDSLNKRQLWRMYQERDFFRRSQINGFPQQMAGLKPLLHDFLQQAFTPSRYEQNPWLRGIYFTSGTQEGSPVDRVMNSLASTFGINLKAQPIYQGQPRSYFITRMFKEILFKESELAGTNVRYEKQRQWLQRGAYALAIGVSLVVIFVWSTSFTRNELWINKLDNRIQYFQKTANNLTPHAPLDKIVNVLQAAKDISLVYGDNQQKTPWLMGMGLYQGIKLGAAADHAYTRVVQQFLLPKIKDSLERQMRSVTASAEDLRRLMSIYLMLGSPDTLDANTFKPWVSTHWEQQLKDEPEIQTRLTSHLDHLLLAQFPAQKLDQRLMQRTQRVVCEIPLTKQIYSRLLQQAEGKIGEYNLARFGKPLTKLLTSTYSNLQTGSTGKSVPGFYTYDGYHEILDKEAEQTIELTIAENRRVCEQKKDVLDKADTGLLLREVRARYFDDYVAQWNNFLSSIKLVGIKNLSSAADTLATLSSRDAPLQQFVSAISEQTILQHQQLKGLLDRFELSKKLAKPSNPVERAFLPIHRLLLSEDDKPSEITELSDQIKALYAYITDIAEASDQTEAAFEAAKAGMNKNGTDAIRKLRIHARNLPTPVSNIVESIATQSWGTVLGGARAYINAAWRSSVLRDYQASLENRYPIFNKGRQQTALVDFGRFFGASGSIDTFINNYLAPFIDTRRWRLRTVDDRNLGLSSQALAQIKRAVEIKQMFFQEGGNLPLVRFSLKPDYLDAGIKRFLLVLNGQQLTYQHGPTRSTKVEWPGPDDTNQVRLIFERIGAGEFSIVKDGPWAWFKMLDDSNLGRRRSDQALVTFSTAGLKARYKILASSVNNPFTNSELSKFRCPNQL